MQTKTCSKCKLEKAVSEFQASKWYKDGYRGQCTRCRNQWFRDRRKRLDADIKRRGPPTSHLKSGPNRDKDWNRDKHLKYTYGITLKQFEEMSIAQDHKCAICQFPASEMFHKKLNVDHCHKTGKVRGLLCASCNSLLGRIGDDVVGVMRVVRYLSGA
jgi:hypothetical protein